MIERFSPDVAAAMADGDSRRQAAEAALVAGLPSTESEAWRYSSIGDLALDDLAPVTEDPGRDAGRAVDRYVDVVTERAATVVLVDGWPIEIEIEPGWADKGLTITVEPVRSRDGTARASAEAEDEVTIFDHLHRAFAPATVRITAPPGLAVGAPVVVVNHHATAGAVSFSHLIVEAGDSADVTVVERQTSSEGASLSVPIVELSAGNAAQLRYQANQDRARSHDQLGRLLSTTAGQATTRAGVAAFGGGYARLRADCRLTGRGATGNLTAAYYGDGDQVHDFRIFQHHDARDTRSDLLFKGAQDDRSGSIYTGLIHIHPDGAGTNAFQTNRNVKLSNDAWAWSVPNLEIENNDVHCSHASTVSPVDTDQQFYLQSRGVEPVDADRLIVAGFFDEVIERLPVAATRPAVSAAVAVKLDLRLDR